MEDKILRILLHVKIALGQIEEAQTELKQLLEELKEEIK